MSVKSSSARLKWQSVSYKMNRISIYLLPTRTVGTSRLKESTLFSESQTKKHWDKLASQETKRDFTRKSWGGLSQISQNHNFLITNDPDYYWIDYMREKYFPNGHAGNTLSLGCGEGFIERLFKEHDFVFDSITGVDLSDKCIEVAIRRAHEVELAPKINYIAANLNDYVLPEMAYDFIFFFHSLHHVEALEQLLEGCAKALNSGGIIMVNEFVGPSRFQWTDEQIALANDVFRLLPEELRYDLQNNNIKTEIGRFSVEEMMQHDESEAVRSAEIEDILRQNFNVVEEKNWGGTLNNLILENTAGNYDPANPYHNTIADLLVFFENHLIENDLIPSDFKFFIAKPK